MASPVKVKNALLCELVSRSDGNKHTLVNVYSGDVVVSHMPAQLQFGLYMEVEIASSYLGALSLEIRWMKKVIVKGVAKLEGRTKNNNAVIALPSFPLLVDHDGVLEVFFSGDGLPRKKLMTKKIYKSTEGITPSPNA